jgi:hypothetical protein
MVSVTKYLEGGLKLKVNQDKSKVGSPRRLKFLGFSLWKLKEKSGIRVHEKSLKRFEDKIRKITKRNRGVSLTRVLQELKTYAIGWLGYYGIADLLSRLRRYDEWIRKRLRMYIWKQWKRVRTRFKNLKRLGVLKDKAWQWANTRKAYWRTAGSPILASTITNKRLKRRGYVSLLEWYTNHRDNDC